MSDSFYETREWPSNRAMLSFQFLHEACMDAASRSNEKAIGVIGYMVCVIFPETSVSKRETSVVACFVNGQRVFYENE